MDARYSKHYTVTTEELAWMAERVAVLRDIVRTICEERLAQFPRHPREGGDP